MEISQKAKIRWSIEGDENSKYFHGIMNKKRSQLAIRGTLANGEWISEPHRVKNEFFTHFKKQFLPIQAPSICFDFTFPTRLSSDQVQDLERPVTYEEVKRAVWDCGTNKSLGPDGFSFEFYRSNWRVKSFEIYSSEFLLLELNGLKGKPLGIGWNMVLTSKKNGGLGVSSFFAHNRALLFKWVWRFLTDGSSLGVFYYRTIFGNKGALDTHKLIPRRSPWQDVILAIHALQSKSINLMEYIQKKGWQTVRILLFG
ncbi:hypothetical protein Tco_0824090 [Tanacetum coccineum]|uniref:RNA-directed DNA polymerase, eukaryota, reverse transcriptase zinc-binding domain protein n=1 Tax=Tanacetum coccineum TaxID=301880 RepID=A0ABQ5AKS9_9ASTR